MAVISAPRQHPSPNARAPVSGLREALLALADACLEAVRHRRRIARDLRRLGEMDERLLRDIGLSRFDVHQIERDGWKASRFNDSTRRHA